MASMGEAICMGRVVDRNWTKVIYAAAMVTACCKFRKIVGPARVEPASTMTSSPRHMLSDLAGTLLT